MAILSENIQKNICYFRDLSLVAKKRQIGGSSALANAILAGNAGTSGNKKSSAERRAHSSCSLGNSFKRGGEEHGSSGKNSVKDKRFLRVDHGGSSRLSKRVHIRRSRLFQWKN